MEQGKPCITDFMSFVFTPNTNPLQKYSILISKNRGFQPKI
jgi:hypothetical protein